MRALAVQTYNAAQDLLYSDDRTPEQDIEMLTLAFTSRHFWMQVGGPRQPAIAEWAVGRISAELGFAEMALLFAERALAATTEAHPAWMRASALEGVARAHAVSGQPVLAADYLNRARAELALEGNPKEAEIISAQIDDVERLLGHA